VLPAEFAGGWQFAPEAVGLRSEQKGGALCLSPWVIFPAGAHRYNPPFLDRSIPELTNWPAGKFNVQWFEPSTGKGQIGTTEVTTDGLFSRCRCKVFRDDLAAIIHPDNNRTRPKSEHRARGAPPENELKIPKSLGDAR